MFDSLSDSLTLCFLFLKGATLRGTIIGFICSTRCKSYTTEAMKVHDGTGKILAIHSVVVEEKFRNCGVGGAMLQDYISHMDRLNNKGDLRVRMEKVRTRAPQHHRLCSLLFISSTIH